MGRGTRRTSRVERSRGDWGVVLTHSRGATKAPDWPWVGAWVDLTGGHPEYSIEFDLDRERTLSALGWDGARRTFGPPRRILVLDDDTRERVLAVVPSNIEVTVADHEGLRELRRALEREVEEEGPPQLSRRPPSN